MFVGTPIGGLLSENIKHPRRLIDVQRKIQWSCCCTVVDGFVNSHVPFVLGELRGDWGPV